jgi:hypothetical protein
MLENPFYHDEESKAERGALRKLFLWFCTACGFALFLLAVTWPTKAHAEPRFQVSVDGVRVVLFDDKCELTHLITNLPYKATWTEKGKTVRGCWGARPDAGIVMAYFEDKTIGLIPMQDVTPVQGA